MNFKIKKAQPGIGLLVLIGVLVRLVVFLLLPASDTYGRYANSGPLYVSALTEHFGDYIRFTTNIPPATFFVHAFVLNLIDAKAAITGRAFVWLVGALDIISVALLYVSALRLGARRTVTFVVMALFSVALVSFELWRDGMHYDHLTLFFTSLFVWALLRWWMDRDRWSKLLVLSVTAALLVSQSAANAAVAPFTMIVAFSLAFLPVGQWKKWMMAIGIGLSLPLFVLILVGKKNSSEAQESLTSNKAGPAMMMVVQRSYDYDVAKVRTAIQQAGAPDWYLWTYDHANVPFDPVSGKPYHEVLPLAQAFGQCFFSPRKDNAWMFDFKPLEQYLAVNDPDHLLPLVQADAADAAVRPYRFAGFSPELSPRWIGVYGNVSKKIFFKTLRSNPVGMFKAFAKQQSVFGICGPLFMYNVSQSERNFLARSALRTLRQPLPLGFVIETATLLFAAVALLVYLLAWLIIPYAMVQSVRVKGWLQRPHSFLLLSIPVVCIAAVYSCLVGGENDRYFMQATPYVAVLACCVPALLRKRLNRS